MSTESTYSTHDPSFLVPQQPSHGGLHICSIRSESFAYTIVLIERKIKNLQPTTDFKRINGNTMKTRSSTYISRVQDYIRLLHSYRSHLIEA